MEIASIRQFGCPSIEALQPRLPSHCTIDIAAQAAITVKHVKISVQPFAITVPDLRSAFQPALEIAASDHLLHELFRVFRPMGGQRRGNRIRLQHQPAPDIG